MTRTLLPFLSVALLFACGGEEAVVEASDARPVTALALRESVPSSGRRATGVVEPYRASQIGFEVGGRVTFVRDVGQEVNGPLLDGKGELLLGPDGEPRRRGDVIATIDDTRYAQAVAAIELRLASTQKELAAQRVDLEKVAAADLESAKAQAAAAQIEVEAAREDVNVSQAALVLATTTVERNRDLVETGAVSQSVLDQSEAEVLTAQARLEQANVTVQAAIQLDRAAVAAVSRAEGAILLKEAQIEGTLASIAELENELARAQTDLDSCVLRAPFSGRITEVAAASGTFVASGQAVATLVLMAPVKVVFTASASEERELLPGMGVRVFPGTGTEELMREGIIGTIFEKDSVADPTTRTFRVGIMIRNPLLAGAGRNTDYTESGAAPVTDIFPLIPMTDDPEGPLFVNVDCVIEEGGQTYVLALPDLDLMGNVERNLGTTYVPRKVPIRLGDEWDQIDRWTIRLVEDTGSLRSGQALLVNPTPESLKGVAMGSREWTLRPGDVVRVALEVGLPPSGLWVPISTIRELNGRTTVVKVDGERARFVEVTVHEAFAGLRRIEGDALSVGDAIILDGVHYVSDGERVEVTSAPSE